LLCCLNCLEIAIFPISAPVFLAAAHLLILILDGRFSAVYHSPQFMLQSMVVARLLFFASMRINETSTFENVRLQKEDAWI